MEVFCIGSWVRILAKKRDGACVMYKHTQFIIQNVRKKDGGPGGGGLRQIGHRMAGTCIRKPYPIID